MAEAMLRVPPGTSRFAVWRIKRDLRKAAREAGESIERFDVSYDLPVCADCGSPNWYIKAAEAVTGRIEYFCRECLLKDEYQLVE